MYFKKRSIAAAVVGVALVASTLVGCDSSGGEPDGVTTLNWWTRIGDATTAQAAEFNKTHDGIQVKVTQLPDDQYVNKVATGIQSSNGPDVLDFDDANGPLFAATGILADIGSRVDALDFADSLNPGMSALGQYDGVTYAVPYMGGPSILLYNKTLYAQAGLPDRAPTTWDEIRSDAAAIRALGDDIYGFDVPGACGGCLSYTVQPLIWASGGQTMTEAGPDQETTYASSPEVAKVFEFYRDIWADGLANPKGETEAGATWGQDWTAGKVGIILAGSWLVAGAEAEGYEVGVGKIPGETGDFSTFAGGDILGISSTSKKQDASWEFITWLLNSELQSELPGTAVGQIPVRSDVLTDAFAEKYPVAAVQLEASTQSNAPNSIATNALQLSATSPWLLAFQSIVFQNADVKSTLEKADEDSRELIKQGYSQVAE